ncbi:MAG TPA: hypothetical protein VGL77_02690 [Armatimonadota bacterium]|jgi:hypothetical protein
MRKRTQRALQHTHFTIESHPALVALVDYAAQRPGLEYGNYGDWHAYRNEVNYISRQWQKICALVKIASFCGITDDQVIQQSESSWLGRYHWDGTQWDYCVGQYFPTEYRAAVMAILNNVIREEERRCK